MTLRALTFTTVCLILLVHLASGWDRTWIRRDWNQSNIRKPMNFTKPPLGNGDDDDDLPNRIVFGRSSVSIYPYQVSDGDGDEGWGVEDDEAAGQDEGGGVGVPPSTEYKYETSLKLALEGGGSHVCGGSILSIDWALTAAHCVYDKPLKWLTFRAGSSKREKGGTVHRVKYYIIHENYNKDTFDYDVAVVRVRDPFRYDQRAYPITLPTREYYDGEKVVVTGWGYKQRAMLTNTRDLLMQNLVILDRRMCDHLYPGQITNRMICAEDRRNKSDICSGDSGGPLVMAKSRVQVGIVSWSHACADGKPSVYVDVFSVASWIRLKVGFDNQTFFEDD